MSIDSELVVPTELEYRVGCRGGLATVVAEIEKRLVAMPSKPKPVP